MTGKIVSDGSEEDEDDDGLDDESGIPNYGGKKKKKDNANITVLQSKTLKRIN
jgi:hypothetical protein